MARIYVIVTSPRVAPGTLTWPAWQALREADAVLAAAPDPVWLAMLDEAKVSVVDVGDRPVSQQAGELLSATDGDRVATWLGGPDGDPGLTDALAEHLSRRAVLGPPPEVELITGSHDLPGARLLDLVAVMDRLRSPGGCPWDAEQTHTSLLPYLLEEAHEVIEAVELGDRAHLREELGDLLLQVVFHSRVAQEDPADPFDIDQVAGEIVAKLIRRHPHVFADEPADGVEDVERNWEALKAAEKQRGLFEGIPNTLPALARASKMLGRLERAGRLDEAQQIIADDELAAGLLELVARARREGDDAEARLRAALARLATVII